MIKNLSKCLKKSNTFFNLTNITKFTNIRSIKNNMNNISNNIMIYKYQYKTYYNKKEDEEDNNSEGIFYLINYLFIYIIKISKENRDI